ncbi:MULTISPECIES: DUF6787 family protein [Flavobacteriaceae]|uniref:DUF6787 family protein n=1 Tax=Flavobacteriaceae TaxID=49546 RepID=UPI00234B6302|nr:DUF6787 family protein [Muricauda sp. SP22]MDC6363446.1 prolipoprotein diacylglyceryl transferase [Muricauda sp. SP22]
MKKIKNRWEIHSNWQLLFPFLGFALVLLTAYWISRRLLHTFDFNNSPMEWVFTIASTIGLYFLMIRFFLWCFKKLEHKWKVSHKWEMIAIFIVFAITGSLSGKLAGPLVEWMGLGENNTHGAIYWTARILLIFPVYQFILIIIGWLFGQFRFFWEFEKKMLKRMGLGFLFP